VEERGQWTARFAFEGKHWHAAADSADGLLNRIGRFELATELRRRAAEPVEKNPELKVKGRPTAEERLSLQWARRAQKLRLKELDALLAECRKSMRHAES
jgi:hypothetical protein